MSLELVFLITALVFTFLGYTFGKKSNTKIIDGTIQSLLDEGYLKAGKNANGTVKILKQNE